MTPVVYGSVTSAQVLPREFWPLQLYAAEPRFVRLNVSVWVAAAGRDGGAVVGLYARRGTFPSHTRYDIFHAVDVDQLNALSSPINSRTRRATSNVRYVQLENVAIIAMYCHLRPPDAIA